MSRSINVVTLSGRAGGDPEFKDIGETTLATLNFAVTNWNGEEETTMWVTLNFWAGRSKVCEYIKKGMKLMVQGQLSIRRVENDDGEVKYYTSVNVDSVELPDRERDDDGPTRGSTSSRGSGSGSKSKARGKKKSGGKKKDKLPF